jgi:hypothetical protein
VGKVIGALVLIALYISFIIDVIRTPSVDARSLPKAVWLLLVIVLPILGGVLWFLFGRPKPAPGSRFGRRRGPIAPDDDPKFLKKVDEEAWRERMRRRRGEEAPD